jgi:small ligand-binding sensory domain FIST
MGAGLSSADDAAEAAAEAARSAADGLAGTDLAFLFLSSDHLDSAEDAAEAVRAAIAPAHLVGCVADGIVGREREIEQGPGIAVWAAALPGAEITPFHVATEPTDEGVAVSGFPSELDGTALVALLVDPYSFPIGGFLARLNEEYRDLPIVGGIANGGGASGQAALIVDDQVHDEGAVGVAVSGVSVATVVSQGCAPIGRDAVVTGADGNIVFELAGKPALQWVRSQIVSLTPEEQALAARGLLAGLVIDENKSEYGRGDYLMRGLIGVDEEAESIAVGEQVRVGQTLRLHVRDAKTAAEDLREGLAGVLGRGAPAGALLFTCNGRGTHMFPAPDHDARLVEATLGTPALAGFFCGGEIGPVGGKAFLHGFTATLAVFLEP